MKNWWFHRFHPQRNGCLGFQVGVFFSTSSTTSEEGNFDLNDGLGLSADVDVVSSFERKKPGGGFNDFLFSPLFGEDSHFD